MVGTHPLGLSFEHDARGNPQHPTAIAKADRIGKIRKAEDRIQNALLVARDEIVADVERAIDRGDAQRRSERIDLE